MSDEQVLLDHVRAAASGDKAAAQAVLEAVADDVYELALRMLGHPADAEDASQEILVVVLTHLGAFRGESAFKTWVWRIAANHLARARRGRRETVAFDVLEDRLRSGLDDGHPEAPDPEEAAMAAELRLRCTEAMVLCLDRDLRIAHILGDVFELPGELCAEILSIGPAAFRKRQSRARQRLQDFMRGWCGLYDEANPCRCGRQVGAAVKRGLLAPDDLYLTQARKRSPPPAHEAQQPQGPEEEVHGWIRAAAVLCGPHRYAAPESLTASLRALFEIHERTP